MNKTLQEKIEALNKFATKNWEIRFHNNLVDINYPDSPFTPDYEDFTSIQVALDAVMSDMSPKPISTPKE